MEDNNMNILPAAEAENDPAEDVALETLADTDWTAVTATAEVLQLVTAVVTLVVTAAAPLTPASHFCSTGTC